MAVNDREILRDKNGAAIPQIWDPNTDQFVPATKEMNIGNLPEVQTVKDDDVKSELEAVKAELEEIKNKTHEVQLTGSYVGLTLSDAPSNVEDGNSFYAINDETAYLYFNGEWREI